ncbi:MAG: hypothetical protein SGCHY_005421 [Lobulomycetales sp.]
MTRPLFAALVQATACAGRFHESLSIIDDARIRYNGNPGSLIYTAALQALSTSPLGARLAIDRVAIDAERDSSLSYIGSEALLACLVRLEENALALRLAKELAQSPRSVFSDDLLPLHTADTSSAAAAERPLDSVYKVQQRKRVQAELKRTFLTEVLEKTGFPVLQVVNDSTIPSGQLFL